MNSRFIPPTLQGAPAPSVAIDFTIHRCENSVWDGDSITHGAPDVTYRWQVAIEAAITAACAAAGAPAPTYGNVAVSGRTSTQTLAAIAAATALKPTVYFLLSSVNDVLNSVAPATTAANYVAICTAILASNPGCRIHVLSNLFADGENWPDGANADDAATVATNAAIKAAIAGFNMAVYHDVRTPIFAIDAPANNPGHLTSGVLTQDGIHPAKPLGQTVWGSRVLPLLNLVMA